jgi:type III restriction enzyme
MDEVESYVKNYNLGFTIPYTEYGESHNYLPDFVVRARPRNGEGSDMLNLLLEVTGEPFKEKNVKVNAARNLWIPAVNGFGAFGKWGFIEVTDLYETKAQVRAAIREAVYA